MSAEVVVLGDVNVDIVARVDSYPPLGGDVQPNATTISVGGTSLNTAIMLARLGVETVLIGRVGRDVLGDFALAEMTRNGLATQCMQRDATTSTGLVYVAVTPDGQRTMFGGGGANRNLRASEVPLDVLRAAHWLHITSYNVLGDAALDATLCALRDVRGKVTTSLDVGVAPLWLAPDALASIAQQVDVLLPSDDACVARDAHQCLVRKLGAHGCEVVCGADIWRAPAFAVDVVDTTGAGDAFNAGFIAGQLRGLDARASALLANACGAAACTIVGAGSAMPQAQVVIELLRARTPRGWKREAGQVQDAL